MRNSLLIVTAMCVAVLCGTEISTRAIDHNKQHDPLIVRDVDFAFDGGSLVFEIGTPNVIAGYLLITAPKSPVRAKGKILCGVNMRDIGKDVGVDKTQVREIVGRMLHHELPVKPLHSEATSFAVAVMAGFEPTRWGPEAVDAIRDSRWLTAF